MNGERAVDGVSMAEGLLTVRELARYLQLNEKTVYEWVGEGRLPCIRLGNRIRFAPNDITRWLASRKES